MNLSTHAQQDLVWWIDNIAESSNPVQCTNPDIIIKSDASNHGWGAVRDTTTTGGGGGV